MNDHQHHVAPVDHRVEDGDEEEESDQARHHQVGRWQTLQHHIYLMVLLTKVLLPTFIRTKYSASVLVHERLAARSYIGQQQKKSMHNATLGRIIMPS